jgi:hypothetical protein
MKPPRRWMIRCSHCLRVHEVRFGCKVQILLLRCFVKRRQPDRLHLPFDVAVLSNRGNDDAQQPSGKEEPTEGATLTTCTQSRSKEPSVDAEIFAQTHHERIISRPAAVQPTDRDNCGGRIMEKLQRMTYHDNNRPTTSGQGQAKEKRQVPGMSKRSAPSRDGRRSTNAVASLG